MDLVDEIREFNAGVSDLLQTKLLNNFILKINLWHIIHFLSGFIIMFIIDRKLKKFKYKYILLFQLLILWELFEIFVRYMEINFLGFFVFKAEYIQDTLLDIIFGMFGSFLYRKFF